MAVKLVAEQQIRVGEPSVVEGASPTPPFVVVFEDDGSTGYLYALDTSRTDPIVDALQIYNVAAVSERHLPSKIQLVWSQDDKKAALLINQYPHAIFDFEARRGYCRTGFPPAMDGWTRHSHEWDAKADGLFG
jgi:hypothetical protein